MSARPRLAFVAPATPADGGNGLAMRAGLFLDALARDHDVSLLVVPVAGPAPTAWPAFVADRTVERACLDVRGREDPAFARALGSGQVRALRSYPRPALGRFATDDTVAEARRAFSPRPFDVVHVMRLYLAPFVDAFTGTGPTDTRTVLDLDDDEVETRRRIASLHARLGQPALMALEAAEADKYRALEGEWLPRFDRLLVCSECDRAAVAARTRHPAVRAIANGARRPDTIAAAAPGGVLRVVFVGSLGYFPNVDAATVLCREVLPRLRARLGFEVAVDVVGSQPAPAVVELGRIPGVTIHADPPEVAPFYARAHVAALPIRAGGGTRLKTLEAFAHGVPVVSTAIGAEGLAVEPGRHLLIADGPDALAAACARVLADGALAARLQSEALELIATRYDAALVGEAVRQFFREVEARVVDSSRPMTQNRAPERAAMDWTHAPQQIEGLEINQLADGYIVYEANRDRVHYLNHTAVLVLEMCNGRVGADEIPALLKQAYDLAEPPTAEVGECLARLRDEGLIR